MLVGCAYNSYNAGGHEGYIPEAVWNANLFLFGARGGEKIIKDEKGNINKISTRSSIWLPLFAYGSYSEGTQFRILGPGFPNLFGYINAGGEKGFVTPIFSSHSGNLDSIAFGPLFFPIFRMDTAKDGYYAYSILGIINFGSYGFSFPFIGGSGSQEYRPLYNEMYKSSNSLVIEPWEGGISAKYSNK